MKIRIITPTFNEKENILIVYESIKKVMANLKLEYDHVVIDNNSHDGTYEILKNIASIDKSFKVIINQKNFGHAKSPYYALLLDSKADATIMLMADLQDPIEKIPELIKNYEYGNQIVLLQRNKSSNNFITRKLKEIYYFLINKFSEHKPKKNIIGSGLYSKDVLDILRKIYDPNPYLRGQIFELGFKIKTISFDQQKRVHGHSKNNLYTLIDFALLGMVKHTKLFRILTFFGLIFSTFSMLIALTFFILKIIFWNYFSLGIAPIVIGLFFLSSIQIFFLGILGEYLGLVLEYNKKLPLVIEKERINF